MTDRITQPPAPPEARDDPAHTIEALNDQLQDQAIELDMLREALGVPYEPHQSLLERMLEAARGRAGSGAAPEPPAQEPMTVAEIEDQSSYWHRWYLKTREELYAVRQGWIRVVDEFLVTRHLGIARPTDTYDEARAKLLKIIDFEIDIATDPVVGGDRVRKKVPMTDEEAKALISPVLRRVPAGNLPQISTGYLIAMMRAVERHHGIGKGESNEG